MQLAIRISRNHSFQTYCFKNYIKLHEFANCNSAKPVTVKIKEIGGVGTRVRHPTPPPTPHAPAVLVTSIACDHCFL